MISDYSFGNRQKDHSQFTEI